jgi:hypothetical protein
VGVLLRFPDKTRIHASEKLMAAVFRDMKGISSVEYMKKGSTITAEIYKETIRKFKTAKKCPTTVIKRLCRSMTIAEFTKIAKSVK